MKRKCICAGVCAVSALLISAAASPQAAEPEPIHFPHAGIALALPADFTYRPVDDKFAVLQAVRKEADRPTLRIILSAFPAGPEETAEALAAAALAKLKGDPGIENFQIIAEAKPMEVAGLSGVAGRVTYSIDGQDAAMVRVCFVRDLNDSTARVGYCLRVVSLADKQSQLLPVLSEVIKSVRLIRLRHPQAVGVPQLAKAVADPRFGYSLRPPRSWFVIKTDAGTAMGQVDYLAGGEATVSAEIAVTDAPAEADAESVAAERIARYFQAGIEGGDAVEIVSQGQGALGGVAGRQFVLAHGPKVPASGPAADSQESSPRIISVHRLVCVRSNHNAAARAYELISIFHGVDPKQAVQMAEQIAAGFAFDQPAMSQPASCPQGLPPTATCPAGK